MSFPGEWAMNSISIHHPSSSSSSSKAHEGGELTIEQCREGDINVDLQEERARCEWEFHLSAAVVSPASSASCPASDSLGALELDPSHLLLASAGIARKIRIYKLSSLAPLDGELSPRYLDHSEACEFYICAPAKLSSLRWRPDSCGRLIGAGDYDGVVTEYDLDRRVAVFERDEHGGRRVWSVSYSPSAPFLGASASDDGWAHVWDSRSLVRVAAVSPGGGAAACCVEFGPSGTHAIAVGCTDRGAYVYDARAMGSGPVTALRGHARAVTYVRFAGDRHVVTSAVDGSHRLWTAEGREVRAYRGHVNGRNFVGMGVWGGGGLIGSGSESNDVFVYDLRWGDPVWVRRFGLGREEDNEPDRRGFVSSVCWKQDGGEEEGVLVAGGSNGVLQVFVAKRKDLH